MYLPVVVVELALEIAVVAAHDIVLADSNEYSGSVDYWPM